MFSFFSNKKEGVKSIVLDIQSGLVRGALLIKTVNDGGIEEIHIASVVTKAISEKTHVINAEHLAKKTYKLISDVIEHLARDAGGKHLNNISYVLSSPWIFSKLKTIKIDYEKETEINSKIIGDLVKEEAKNNPDKADAKPIEQRIFEIRLNGYPTVSFEGKRARRLEVSISTSFGSSSFLDKVRAVVDRHIHIKSHSVHSALLMQYSALREILKNRSEFVYIHAHRELTDIIIVKDGLCKHIASFPFGTSMLVRKVSAATKETVEASDSLLSLLQGGKLNDEQQENINRIITPVINEWSDQCIKSFDGVFDMNTTPRQLYLSVHSHFEIFKKSLMLKGGYNFEVVSCDTLNVGNSIIFDKESAQSNLIKMYIYALSNEM